MSIFAETGGAQSAVAHDRSLELFFDRYDVIARFVSLINDDPPPRQVLYLHGLGGNGKSLLLRFLAARCCVRLTPPEWGRVRGLPMEELPTALGSIAKAALRSVPIPFSMAPKPRTISSRGERNRINATPPNAERTARNVSDRRLPIKSTRKLISAVAAALPARPAAMTAPIQVALRP